MNGTIRSRWDRHSLIWAAGILAVSAGYLLLVERPRIQRMGRLNEEVAQRTGDLATRAQSLETLARTGREVASLAARVADFDDRIPSQPRVGPLLEDLARVAEKRRLASDAIQPGEPVRTSEVVALPIAMKVRGPFAAVHGFVSDVEAMHRLIRFERFSVSVDDEHPGLVKADLGMKVFYEPGGGAKSG
ncbi:MAG: type 4a pilus biogenesis protein PilO [Phycisphaerae bacterium]|jgi:Tfp pilus assembly protein PilO